MSRFETVPKGTPGWQVVSEIRRHGEMTIRDLVAALGVTTTAIRLQVDRLVGDGVLAVEKRGGRRGRPSDVFQLTEHGRSLVRHQYDRLLDLILTELEDQEGPDKVSELLGRVAEKLADGYAQRITGATAGEKLATWVELLQEQDIPAEVKRKGKLVILRQCGCPYYKLARVNRSVCGVHIRLLNHLVAGGVRRTRCLARGDTHCEFEMSSNGHADPPAAEQEMEESRSAKSGSALNGKNNVET